MCFLNYNGLGVWFIPIVMIGMIVLMALFMQLFMRFRMGHCCGWPLFKGQQHADEDALSIVKRRYANGEISKEDFDKIKSNLS
ncbi:MAG: SHOCT domain-containing protein [Desulfovibrio sp.]|nr:SHOCT domain-containing protein [Desulfovibrio sp.]MBI4958816.1 SHOCT domain-containing protein [Desulfovibrio sp.]